MSGNQQRGLGIRPKRASDGAGELASRTRNPFGGPADFVEGKSFQSGATSIVQLLTQIDSREQVTAPYEECGWVRACLKPIEQAVASVPLRLYRGDPNEDKKSERIDTNDRDLGGLVRLLDAPTPIHTQSQFFGAGVLHRKLDGEDFWFLLGPGRDGVLAPLMPRDDGMLDLPSAILSVRGRAVGLDIDARGFPKLWRVGLQGGGTLEAPASSVIQFKDYNPDDPLRGLGDIETLYAEIDYWWQATRYNRALVKNGGDPGGWILNEGATLAPEEADAAQQDAKQKFDVSQAGKWRLMPKGLKYQANSISPKDMNFAELMKWTRDTIASVTGVPLPVIGVLDHATLANFQDSVRMFWQGGNGILPYLASLEDVLTNRFVRRLRLPGVEHVYARFDTRRIKALREDTSKQYELAQKLASAGIGLSLEEALKLVGIDSDTSDMPYAKARMSPAGLVPMSTLVSEDGDPVAVSDTDTPESELSATDTPAMPVAGATAVQDTALNGAQIASLLSIAQAVAEGTLTPDGAVAMILASFPTIPEERARQIVDGVVPKDPEPDPDETGDKPPAGDSGPDSGPDGDDEPDDAAKSIVVTRDADAPADPASERRTYWDARAPRLFERGEKSLRRAYKSWRRRYERAQLARLRAAVGERSIGKADDGPPLDGTSRFSAEDVADLLLSDAEWIAKLRAATHDPIARIFADALEDLAADMGSAPMVTTDHALAGLIETQVIKLAEGHTSTLADQVREVLVEELSKANSTGSVAQALTERLGEVEDALETSWMDRVNRGNLIARTETGTAVNSARLAQMRADGVTAHEWVSSKDSFVRGTPGGEYEDSEFSHYDLDGKVVNVGSEFAPNLRHPGDVDAPAGHRCNCRCLSRPAKQPNEGGGTPAEE